MQGTVSALASEEREFDAVGTLARAGEEARRELWRWSAAFGMALAGGAAGLVGAVILGVVTGLISPC